MKKLFLLLALTALVSLSGCMQSSFVYTNATPGDVTEESRGFLFYGLSGPDKPYRADKICGAKGVASVETYASFGNQCIGCLTLAIYTPHTVRVTCGTGTAHNFYLDENERVVAHEVIDNNQSVVEDFTSNVF